MTLFAFYDMPLWLMGLLFLVAIGLGVMLFVMQKKKKDD